jgi:hypothetical protein
MVLPKLHLDEDVTPKVAEALRRSGFDVIHIILIRTVKTVLRMEGAY